MRRSLLCLLAFVLLQCICADISAAGANAGADSVGDANAHPAEVIKREAKEVASWAIAIRRRLHSHPELLYELHKTSAYVREVLDSLNISYVYPVARVGIVATIGTGASPVVALRADMDALPIHEEVESEYVSQVAGKMHACGHDGHTAMLLGAARLLKAREASIKGTIRLIFQPAEEGGGGALQMIREGVLENPKVERMFGLHVWPAMPSGHVFSRPRALMAAAGVFEATFRGLGGHAAIPGSFRDPVVAVAAAITSLQSIVARDTSTVDPAVVSVTRLRGGDAFNIIPDVASFGGTIRSFSREGYNQLESRVVELLNYTAKAYRAELTYEAQALTDECLDITISEHFPGKCVYPPVLNDPAVWAFGSQVAEEVVGKAKVAEMLPTMGGEDFAYYAERVPSSFFMLGTGDEAKGTTSGLHTPKFTLDEDVLEIGIALHTLFGLRSIQNLNDAAQ